MLILEASNIKKYYGDRLVIGFDGFKAYSGDKIGIVGQNGAGKTTLMNILARELAPDEGVVRHSCEYGYIRQLSGEEMDADPRVLKEFDLAQKDGRDRFSGGESTRIKIANVFSREKLLVFADEPTANLDYKGVELLRKKLAAVDTLILISHDRDLLDSLCNRIIEVRDGGIRFYEGNYSAYRRQNEMEREYAELEYEKYTSEKAGLEAAIADRRRKSGSIKKTPSRMGNSEARLHKREATEKQQKINNAVNGLKTRLEKLEVKERPKEMARIKLDFSMTNPPENKIVLSADGLYFGYGSSPLFENAGFKAYNGCKTALWGENGTGKSTLLNLIHERENDRIYIVPKARIGYFRQGFENLEEERTVLENVMQDSVQNQTVARTVLARLLLPGDEVYKKVAMLSGGERIKVSFAKLFVSDANVLLLDEPTNYLDMMSIEALQSMLCEYEGTVLFVSHDRAFVNAVADRLLIFKNRAVEEFEGNLEEYEAVFEKRKEKKGSSKGKTGSKKDRKDGEEPGALSETDRMILQMRITEVVARLSRGDQDREALEAEYQQMVMKLR